MKRSTRSHRHAPKRRTSSNPEPKPEPKPVPRLRRRTAPAPEPKPEPEPETPIEIVDMSTCTVLGTLPTKADAARAFGIHEDDVDRMCVHELFSELVCGHGLQYAGRVRTVGSGPINQYDQYGHFMAQWRSIAIAAAALRLDQQFIYQACARNGNRPINAIAGGKSLMYVPENPYIWTYVEHDYSNRNRDKLCALGPNDDGDNGADRRPTPPRACRLRPPNNIRSAGYTILVYHNRRLIQRWTYGITSLAMALGSNTATVNSRMRAGKPINGYLLRSDPTSEQAQDERRVVVVDDDDDEEQEEEEGADDSFDHSSGSSSSAAEDSDF